MEQESKGSDGPEHMEFFSCCAMFSFLWNIKQHSQTCQYTCHTRKAVVTTEQSKCSVKQLEKHDAYTKVSM